MIVAIQVPQLLFFLNYCSARIWTACTWGKDSPDLSVSSKIDHTICLSYFTSLAFGQEIKGAFH